MTVTDVPHKVTHTASNPWPSLVPAENAVMSDKGEHHMSQCHCIQSNPKLQSYTQHYNTRYLAITSEKCGESFTFWDWFESSVFS